MGLEGTLRVFSLTDIFQVLGLQRKSGVLTVEGEEDTISVAFLGGQVVSAESAARGLDNRIGSLLVRAGRITQEQLDVLLEKQKETQQRLGFLLIRDRLVTPEDLREALRLQIVRIVFSSFRWTEGRFRFSQEGTIDYDADHMSPVPTESILMEAAQMLDEWPRLEQKVRSREAVFRRAAGVGDLQLVTSGEGLREGHLVVSKPEAEVWRWIDGSRTVADIMERAFLSDFEIYKGFADLLDRNLIEDAPVGESPAPVLPAAVAARASAARVPLLWALVLAAAALAVFLLPRNPWNALLRSPADTRELADFMKAVSLDRLVTIERSIRVYYDSTGRYPRSLEDLVLAGILDASEVRDPYGRPYRYILRSEDGKFGLYGRNARGNIDLDLSLERSLAPVSEMHPVPARLRQLESRPGVQLIE